MNEFLKGYMRKKMGGDGVWAGYSRDGGSRGPAQACDKAMYFRGMGERC